MEELSSYNEDFINHIRQKTMKIIENMKDMDKEFSEIVISPDGFANLSGPEGAATDRVEKLAFDIDKINRQIDNKLYP